jgi:hypothetical protein
MFGNSRTPFFKELGNQFLSKPKGFFYCQRGNYPEIQDSSKRACRMKKLKKAIKEKQRWEELSKSIEW